MKALSTALAVSLLALLGVQANAATVTECGTDVCFTYDNATNFGSANIIGNNIFFLPTDFIAESYNGEGAVSTNSTLQVRVDAIGDFNMQKFQLQESGDYYLSGDGASATAGGMFAVTSTTKTCPDDGLFPCREQELLNAGPMTTQGTFDEWNITSEIDLTGNSDWISDSGVIMTIKNRLSATTLNLGEEAFVEKKIAGVGITVVPVPAAVWLLGSALGGLACLRRKRTIN